MRVLVACDWFLKYAVEQVAALARAGAEVSLMCRSHALEFGGSAAERLEALDKVNGVPTYVLPGRISTVAATTAAISYRREIHAWRPDVVHAHDNADPRLLMIVAGLPRVLTIHDPVPHPGHPAQSRIENAIRRRWITGAQSIVVHGQALVTQLPAWMRRRPVAVIPHGADIRAHPLPPPLAPCVLLFGRLEPYKGIDVLVRAMNQVWQERPDVRLRIAGEGRSASIVPYDPRIELMDQYVPEHELETLFAGATLAVLPYTQASQTGVGALSLGYGVPTIVTDVGALREIALDESFVVPAGDDDALARAILRKLDHGEAERQAVLAFARSRMSWDTCARASLRLYESVVEQVGA